jgi:hypothetical protein
VCIPVNDGPVTKYGPISYSGSYNGAIQYCQGHSKELCIYDQLCPNGVGSAPAVGEQLDNDQWVPYACNEDTSMWVQVGVHDQLAVCGTHETYGKPVWGSTETQEAFQQYIYCCGE